ncbi:hypothetical protein Sru01_49410 [Sphaerisporangium rufum]|uniref:histidine kinase n=1 Tax=Sphaerisporangium rufum TaxID=1381558 RepID=A0A919R5D1_9ACTN|nr:sensor histidine kinase [Sphaerisporangium rufum]GII79959.1 hypothetical protein Sru01_49410 [Sphaerisporangium rufum]
MACFDRLRDTDRPFPFDLVFWAVMAVLIASLGQMVATGIRSPLECVVFGTNLVLVTVLWMVLPWHPARGRRWTAPAFLAATILLGWTGSSSVHMPLTLIAVANLPFLYRMRYVLAIVCCLVVQMVLAEPLLFGKTLASGLVQGGAAAVFSTFVLGMALATLEARRRREEAQELLERIRELAVAEERARMAAEMHDSVGHHLTVIKMGLENAERFRQRRPEDAWAEVRQAKDLTAAALTDARRWVRVLRPLALDSRMGSAALEGLAASFDGTGVSVRFEVRGMERRLEPDIELVLYRVLQEGLTNALRHSGAERVRGTLTFEEEAVVLVVSDDGRGTGGGATGGFGLSSLAERARALGGAVAGADRPGGGFELRAELPLVKAGS